MIEFSQMKPRFYSIHKRKSKVDVSLFAKNLKAKSISSFLKSLPYILAAKDLKELVLKIKQARKCNKEVIFMYGAHVIKCGISPLLIDLMKRGFITCLATNGAGIIHDFEIAYCGKTSEDVAENLKKGMFGMSKETSEFINEAANLAYQKKCGFGESLGRLIDARKLKYRNYSPCYWAYKKKIPFSVFVAIGTDIVHQYPSADGKSIGFASLYDFHKFKDVVFNLEKGVVINAGSAVILPEVFIKALNLSRNLGSRAKHFTAAVFDMYQMYRPYQNVILRPSEDKGFYFVGQHEIMLPLLYQMLINNI